MKPELQRIAIAEACGWKVGPPLVNPAGDVVNNNYAEDWRLPDYLNDLNAIDGATKTLTMWEGFKFCQELRRIVATNASLDMHDPTTGALPDLVFYQATAAQRAEAFLRTLNLWTEDGDTST